MALARREIPRAWILPEVTSNDRLQCFIAKHEAERVSDTLAGFTHPYATLVAETAESLHDYGTATNAHNQVSDEAYLGTFESEAVKVPGHVDGYALYMDPSGYPCGTYTLLSLGYYDKAVEADDPKETYYVALWWDSQLRLWRLPDERWGFVQLDDGPVTDPHAPEMVAAFVQEAAGSLRTSGSPFPSLHEVLQAYVS